MVAIKIIAKVIFILKLTLIYILKVHGIYFCFILQNRNNEIVTFVTDKNIVKFALL